MNQTKQYLRLVSAVFALGIVFAAAPAQAFVSTGTLGPRIGMAVPMGGLCEKGETCPVTPSWTAFLELHFVDVVANLFGEVTGELAESLSNSPMADLMRSPILKVIPCEGRMSSDYGYRIHPIFRFKKKHAGIDIAAPRGTPVHSAADGVVSYAGRRGGYGKLIIVDHGNGVTTRYAHLRTIKIKEGQTVKAGELIGQVGSTGHATGPHLHFEARINGVDVDPMGLMKKDTAVAAR